MSHNSTESGIYGGGCARLFAAFLLFVLAGCSTAPPREPVDVQAAAGGVTWPADALSRYQRALGLMDEGRDAEASKSLQELAADYPDYAGPLTNLGILAARDGDPDGAEKYFQLALTLCTTCAPAWNQLGILQRQRGRFAEAEEDYLQALASDPQYALAHYNLGVLYDLYQARHAEAIEHYESYVALALPGNDTEQVDRWIADLRRRIGDDARTANAGELE